MDRSTRGLLAWQLVATVAVCAACTLAGPAHLIWSLYATLFGITYAWAKTRRQTLPRAEARRLARSSGGLFGLATAGCFCLFHITYPGQTDAPLTMIPVLGLLLGALATLASGGTTLMALDTTGIEPEATPSTARPTRRRDRTLGR